MPENFTYSQVQGTASTGTYATLYTTPSATQAVISTIVVCNQAAATVTIRIGMDDTAGTPGTNEFLLYDVTLLSNDTLALTLGICMPANKFIRVSSSANTCSFTAFVSEIT